MPLKCTVKVWFKKYALYYVTFTIIKFFLNKVKCAKKKPIFKQLKHLNNMQHTMKFKLLIF